MRLGVAAVASVKRAVQALSLDAAMATETAATQDLLARIFGTTAPEICVACAKLKEFECSDPLDAARILPYIPFPESVLKGVVYVERRQDFLYFT